jgi:hypothetical protein
MVESSLDGIIMQIKSLADVVIALQSSMGRPPPELEQFLREYDFSSADQEDVFTTVEALMCSHLIDLLSELSPRLDLHNYKIDTRPFYSLWRHTGKVINSFFDILPALIRSGACPHKTQTDESLVEWMLWYAQNQDAVTFGIPRRVRALEIFDFDPNLENVKRPELLMYCIAHLNGESELKHILQQTGWDINSNFGTMMMSGTATGRPALGIATGHHDLLAVKTLLRCGASPEVLVYDYRRTRSMVPLVEYASHYPPEVRAALEDAYLERQRDGGSYGDNDPIGL